MPLCRILMLGVCSTHKCFQTSLQNTSKSPPHWMSLMGQVSVMDEDTEVHYRAPMTPLVCCLDRLRPTLMVAILQMSMCDHLLQANQSFST